MSGPQPFALGEAPEPAEALEPVKKPRKTGLETHTGTDPYGRAIGPAEDHTEPKLDIHGRTAAESPTDYEGRKVEELQAEADRRGLQVEGTGKDGRVLKADLVAALEAADGPGTSRSAR